MEKYFAKIIGVILLSIAVSIVADLTRGIPAGGILNLITVFAPLDPSSITWAQIGSFFFALLVVLLAFRFLYHKPSSRDFHIHGMSKKSNLKKQ